ncbi:ornithine cyclodeaminase family protein [Aquibacillus saliphilus]|uniref:ornithine cyclodeaminase family protein n=1 Tax=Aquibacillus saliphilus TaxID=1909422 RepID=UPI001CF04A86|nr:ornithine cyclodeaminase family protein [Aquibacillus saliphilus]
MLVINANQQKSVMNMKEVIDACATALQEYSAGRTETPIRSTLPVEKFQGKSLTMPSVAPDAGVMGLKQVNSFPNNIKVGKKSIHGVVFLSDIETGEPLALLEGSYLTVIKTGAVSGLATKLLSREDSSSLSVIGTGEQAPGLVEAIMTVRSIKEIFLVNRTRSKAEEFREELLRQYSTDDLTITVLSDADEAVAKADIIVTSTGSTTPVFSADSVKQGTHINAVGAFQPTMQEIPSQIVATADKIFVESISAALEETGDLQIPIKEGVFQASDLDGELGTLIDGKLTGRINDQEITLFESVGLAVADIIVADLLYKKALKSGNGTHVDI